MKRRKMSLSKSKKHFTKHGLKTHRKNVLRRPMMRGGIRL